MKGTLTAAQRRALTGSDPVTGRLAARADVCAALAAHGLAVRHGRSGHHGYYLTPEGLRLRADLTAARPDVPPPGRPAPAADTFAADDGTGAGPPGGPRRAAEVATAWEGLLRIRSLLLDGSTGAPAPWERDRPVHAVALALEAAGCPPARPGSPGYAVTAAGEREGEPRVTWRGGPDGTAAIRALARCAELLGRYGWQCTEHRTREGEPFLLVSPSRTR
ncbi:hypothetical protein [Streptomyces sp. NRRL F-5123]|uniref:hypothetical protein n=1 Tax=Streptomyces sp. NRRL F-5123 TaxID=1463856 RepID=UPI0004E148E5|nr:hypothetical protein [Streptomyces sp. NRRL F-5123]